MKHGKQKNYIGLWSIAAVVIVILLGFNFYLIGKRSASNKPAHEATTSQASVSSQTSSSSSQSSAATITSAESQPTGNADDSSLSFLKEHEGKIPEDADTVSGGDPTYSRFYINNDDNWIWELSSDRRGIIEKSQVLSSTTNGDGATLNMQSITNDGYKYQLAFRFGNDNGYHVDTTYKDINGDFNA